MDKSQPGSEALKPSSGEEPNVQCEQPTKFRVGEDATWQNKWQAAGVLQIDGGKVIKT